MKIKNDFDRLSKSERLYEVPIPVIGLTGGIATGKSTVARLMEKKGITVIDADRLVKNIYQRPETAEFIRSNYPFAWINNAIDFKLLRENFFKNPDTKASIESFIYSRLKDAFLKSYQENAAASFLVYDVPLLFEKKMQNLFDLTVLVYSDRETQKKRLMIRDQQTAEMAEIILEQQMSIEEKRTKADFIIENSGSENSLAAEVDKFLLQVMDY
jgi:dephospho-CoA kinase